jgi:hypothetical protein
LGYKNVGITRILIAQVDGSTSCEWDCAVCSQVEIE